MVDVADQGDDLGLGKPRLETAGSVLVPSHNDVVDFARQRFPPCFFAEMCEPVAVGDASNMPALPRVEAVAANQPTGCSSKPLHGFQKRPAILAASATAVIAIVAKAPGFVGIQLPKANPDRNQRVDVTPTNPRNANASHDCPPAGATAVTGDVYRCCKADPPSTADMQTHEETGRLPAADPCLRRALSVFRSETDAQHQVRLFPGWRRRFVAKATLNAGHGQSMLSTGQQPTHTSWWPAESLAPASRAALFTVVCEVRL